jgi:hypothetical protein
MLAPGRSALLGSVLGPVIRLAVRRLPARQIAGFRVAFACRSEGLDDLVLRLAEGLALLEQRDPLRFSRARRELMGIVVEDWGTKADILAHYDFALRMCVLNASFLREAGAISALDVALSVVHEATHARLHRVGIGACQMHNDGTRIRTERICKRSELAFSNRLPEVGAIRVLREKLLVELAGVEREYPAVPTRQRQYAYTRGLVRALFGDDRPASGR